MRGISGVGRELGPVFLLVGKIFLTTEARRARRDADWGRGIFPQMPWMIADGETRWVHLGGAMCDNARVAIKKNFSRGGAEVAEWLLHLRVLCDLCALA